MIFGLGGVCPCVPWAGFALNLSAGGSRKSLANKTFSSSWCRTTCTSQCSRLRRCFKCNHLLVSSLLSHHSHLLSQGYDRASLQVNVMPFDPQRGADHARAYATKYASKPEIVDGSSQLACRSLHFLVQFRSFCRKWYVLEVTKNGLKDWLKSRTVGLGTAVQTRYMFRPGRALGDCEQNRFSNLCAPPDPSPHKASRGGPVHGVQSHLELPRGQKHTPLPVYAGVASIH